MEAQVKPKDFEVGKRMAIAEMVQLPGWSFFTNDLEDALFEAMFALLNSDPNDPAASVKVAYWRGRVDAMRAMFLWEIDWTSETKEEQEIKTEGFFESLKNMFRKMLWGGKHG